MKKSLLYLFLFFFSLSCSHSVLSLNEPPLEHEIKSKRQLIRHIDALFSHPYFSHAHWGVLIQSLETGEIWYEHQADKLFNPASNNKIITSATTLLSLGPDYRFTNIIYGDGSLIDSVYHGNLIIKCNGDPTLYTRFLAHPKDLFVQWADSLKSLGIKSITGHLYADASSFDNEIYGYGWAWDDFDYYYSAEISPFQLNENYIDIQIIAPKDSLDPIHISTSCPSSYYTLHNEITLIDSGENNLNHKRQPNSNDILLSGELCYGTDTLEISQTLHNPAFFYTHVFRETLEEAGLKVNGTNINNTDSSTHIDLSKSDTLLLSYSPPLNEILAQLMKPSQNLYAETMVKTMGFELKGFGSFDSGRAVVRERLKEMGIEPENYRYMDGSGLSRYNYISPRQLSSVLSYMHQHDYSDLWHKIQAIAGVDGTLEHRMEGTRAMANVHAKTGTLSSVRGLSGYVTTADGEDLVFSFLINGHIRKSSETDLITDRVLVMLANLNRPFR